MDIRLYPFYASVVSVIVLATQMVSGLCITSKRKEKESRFWLPDSRKRTRKNMQTTSVLASIVQVILMIILPGRTTDEDSATLLVYLIYAAFLQILSYFERFSIYRLNYHGAIVHLGILAVYIFCELVPISKGMNPQDLENAPLVYSLIFLLTYNIISQGLLPRYILVDAAPTTDEYKYSPGEVASPISFLFYSYISPLVWLAYKKSSLDIHDLPPLPFDEKAESIGTNALPLVDPLSKRKSKYLLLGLASYLRAELIAIGILTAFEVINAFAGPVAILKILGYLEDQDHDGLVRPWVWILWLAGGPILRTLFSQYGEFITSHAGVKLEIVFNQLIFLHALRTRLNSASTNLDKKKEMKSMPEPVIKVQEDTNEAPPGSMATESEPKTSGSSTLDISATDEKGTKKTDSNNMASKQASIQAGSVSNLLAIDASNIEAVLDWAGVVSIVKSGLCFALLYGILGWSSLVGCAILILTLPLPGYLVKLRTSTEKAQMKKADKRLQVVNQTMSAIRMIKLFGWEKRMEDKIAQVRNEELRQFVISEIIDTATHFTTRMFPVFVMLGTYTCYVLVMKRPLHASLIFSSITLFDMLREEIFLLSLVLPGYIRAKVSIDRISAFLNSRKGELVNEHQLRNAGDDASIEQEDSSKRDILIRHSRFTWKVEACSLSESDRKSFYLRIDGEIKFHNGGLNLITGPTGCGKTSLLMSLLGEMAHEPLSNDALSVLPREEGVAYAAQESWVLNETIRENILFRSEYNERRYKEVLRQCALEHDLALFDAGDQTEVGERGITLSGGQKARITLARAVYSSAQILLLDDILSALDAHTSRWIVEQCLGGDLLKGRTVLLVTHNVLLVSPFADYMVTLNQDGTVQSQGTVDRPLEETVLSAVTDKELHLAEGKEYFEKTAEEQVLEQKGKQIAEEEVAIGRVSWPVFKLYLQSLGGLGFYLPCTIGLLLFVCQPVAVKGFLAYWANQYDTVPIDEIPVILHLGIYSILSMGESLLGILVWCISVFGIVRAGRLLHQALVHSVLSSTLRWLDTTPISRILTRCSQDVDTIDRAIGSALMNVTQYSARVSIQAIAALVVAGWQMIIPAIVTVVAGLSLGRIYITAQLPMKRLMSNAKSPIIGHIQNALVGLVSVRAYGAQGMFQKELQEMQDVYSTIAMPYWDLSRWIAVRIEVMGGFFSGIVALWLVYGQPRSSAATGFSIVLLVNFNRQLLTLVQTFNSFELLANSLERVRDYLLIEHEPEPTKEGIPPAYWPASGSLSVENLTARYSENGPEVLKNISFVIKSGERIGVVGRTGAGKSSLGLALLRAIPTSGRVFFDNRDTEKTNLDALRLAISIIPQTPELLEGSLRENLDPLNEHDGVELNAVLRAASLMHYGEVGGETSHEFGLDMYVESSGSNFSQGQRQIIALARALIRRTKLIIMDEATSAVDNKADQAIQKFIRTEFNDVTMIIVAHRLQTIMDCDKILVLDSGKLVEFAAPRELLQIEGGYFKGLVDRSAEREQLYAALIDH